MSTPMTNKTTPDDNWLSKMLDEYYAPIKLPDNNRKGLAAAINAKITELLVVPEDTSDGYHTFKELYAFRLAYNALLFNEYAKQGKYSTYKSTWHSDGELPFGGGWFVVGCQLPTGQITNHYELKDWDKFIVPEVPRAPKWDGHTALQALERLQLQASQPINVEEEK
jgi:hypothetical protein